MYGAGYSRNNGTHGRFNNAGRSGNGAGRGRSKIHYSNCQILGHSKENFYKLIGYPSGWIWKIRRPGMPDMFNANKRCDICRETASAFSATKPEMGYCQELEGNEFLKSSFQTSCSKFLKNLQTFTF